MKMSTQPTPSTRRTFLAVVHVLASRRIPFHPLPEVGVILTGSLTEKYRDATNRPQVGLAIHVVEDGQLLYIEAPMAWSIPADHPHLDAVLRTAAEAMGNLKLMRFGYDRRNGELKPSIHVLLMDASPTEDLILRAVASLPDMLDITAPLIARALATGEPSAPPMPSVKQTLQALAECLGMSSPGDFPPDSDTPLPDHPRFRSSMN